MCLCLENKSPLQDADCISFGFFTERISLFSKITREAPEVSQLSLAPGTRRAEPPPPHLPGPVLLTGLLGSGGQEPRVARPAEELCSLLNPHAAVQVLGKFSVIISSTVISSNTAFAQQRKL